MLLPYVLEFNGDACPDRFRDMGRAFGLEMNGMSDEEAVAKVVEAVRSLAIRLNIPQHNRNFGGKEYYKIYVVTDNGNQTIFEQTTENDVKSLKTIELVREYCDW